MIEDCPGDAESVVLIREMTTITNDRVAQLFLGLGANSVALAAHLYSKFEEAINDYFVEQSILPIQTDVENEALRFAIWMFTARDLDAKDGDEKETEQHTQQDKGAKNEELTQESKMEELEEVESKREERQEESADESEGLYDA